MSDLSEWMRSEVPWKPSRRELDEFLDKYWYPLADRGGWRPRWLLRRGTRKSCINGHTRLASDPRRYPYDWDDEEFEE